MFKSPGMSKISSNHAHNLFRTEIEYGIDLAHHKSPPVMPTNSPALRSNTEYTRQVKNHLQSCPQPLPHQDRIRNRQYSIQIASKKSPPVMPTTSSHPQSITE